MKQKEMRTIKSDGMKNKAEQYNDKTDNHLARESS